MIMNTLFSKVFSIVTICIVAMTLSSCYYGYNDKSKRNKAYAPNMYKSLPPEPYSQTVEEGTSGEETALNPILDGGLHMQPAPDGTVPRTYEAWYQTEEYVPFHYPNTTAAYDSAGKYLTSPYKNEYASNEGINCSQQTFERGKVHYERFCINCHGPNGMGQGNLVTSGAFGGVPAYNDDAHKDLPAGKMFFSITYGKGVMGPHAYQLTPEERWEVICYIQEFQKVGNQGQTAQVSSDEPRNSKVSQKDQETVSTTSSAPENDSEINDANSEETSRK